MTPHEMLEECLLTVTRRKWLILCTFVLAVAGLCGYLYVKYPLHKATVLILVHANPREQPTLFHDIVAPTGVNLRSNPVRNLIEISRSTDLARQIVNEFELVERTRMRAESPETLRDKFWWCFYSIIKSPIKILQVAGILGDRGPTYEHDAIRLLLDDRQDVRFIADSELISFSVWEEDPVLAADIANRLAELLVEKTIVMSQSKASVAYAVTADLAEEAGEEFRKLETELAKAKREQNLIALETQQRQVLDRIARAQGAYDAVVEQEEGLRARLAELTEQLDGLPERIPLSTVTSHNPLVNQIEMSKYFTEMDLVSRELESGEENPDIVSLRAKLARTDDRLGEEEPTIVASETTTLNPLHQELTGKVVDTEIELKSAAARGKALDAQIASLREQLQTLADKERMLSQLERRKRNQEEVYSNLENKLAKLEVEQLNRMSEFDTRIVDGAYLPANKKKDYPRYKWYLLVGIPVAFVLAILVAFLVNYFDDTFVTPFQLERQLGVPVLGCVPKVRKARLAISR